MATQSSSVEIYEKRNASHVKTIGDYQNKTRKLIWYERFNQKCCLASVAPTSSGEKNLYKMKLSLTRDEMLRFYECLVKAKKGGRNDFILSEGEDYQKNPTRLVLRDSKLTYMTAERALDKMVTDVPSGDEDVDGVMDSQPLKPTVELEWLEAWAKFYVSKNEDWLHVAKVIKYFLAEVDHEMEVDSESTIPTKSTTSTAPLEVQALTQNLLKTTKGKTSEGSKKKRKRPTLDSDREVCVLQKEVKELVLETLKKMTKDSLSFEDVVAAACPRLDKKNMIFSWSLHPK